MIKKIFFSMLLMLVCIPVFAANEAYFYYDSERVEEMWITKISGEKKQSTHPYFLKRKSDNTYVYCIELFEPLYDNVKYIYDSKYSNYGLSKQDIDRINLIIYYGYGYKNHTSDKWYGLTQYLIWKTSNKDADIYFSKEKFGSKVNLYDSEIKEIESLIKEHNTEPNFIKNYIISTNDNLVINSNIDLSNYSINTNAKYEIRNNKLYFNNLDVGNYTVKLKRKDNRFKSDYLLYYSKQSQNIIVPGDNNIFNKEYTFNIKVEEGTVSIKKKNEDNIYLEGAKYDVYKDNNVVTTLVTNNNGLAQVNLPYGKYKLKEVEAPEGYELDNNEYEFEISSSNLNVEYELTDSKIYVDFSINKKDKETNEYLKGAKYGIFKDNKLVSELITDSKGYAKTSLSFGTYIIRELEAPYGYELDDKDYTVIIKSKDMKYDLVLDDMKIYTQVKFSKKSSYNNKYLENAVYGIYKDGNIVQKIISQNGVTKISLPYGEYEIKELIAPPGYKLDSNTYKLNINSNKEYELNLLDEKIVISVPNTGIKKSNKGYILILFGSLGLFYGKKKYNLY